MDISQISTDLSDLMNLVEVSNDEEEEKPLDFSDIWREEPSTELKDDAVGNDPKQPSPAAADAAAEEAPKIEPATPRPKKPLADAATPATAKTHRRNASAPLFASTPIAATKAPAVVSPSPAKEQASGKLMFSSEVHGLEKTAKRKSWFGKRKSKTKNKKPLKKLSDETKIAIYQHVGKRPDAKTKTGKAREASEIPTVIKLKKITKPPSQLPNVKEVGTVVDGRNLSFSDSVSTLSHHAHHDESNWLEKGMSSLLNNVFGPEGDPDDDKEIDDKMVDALLMGISKEEVERKELQRPSVDENAGGTTWTNPTDSAEPPSPSGPDRGDSKPTGKGTTAGREKPETVTMEPIPEKSPTELAITAEGKLIPSPLRVGQSNISGGESKDQESNTETGTDFSESYVKHSQTDTATLDDQGTYEHTLGTVSTAKDGTWLELGVSRMLDGPFSIGLGEDVEEDVFDDLESESAPSKRSEDTSEHSKRGLPKFRYKKFTSESSTADSEKKEGVAAMEHRANGKGKDDDSSELSEKQVVADVEHRAKDNGKYGSSDEPSAAAMRSVSPKPVAEAESGGGWLSQGMPSMFDLVALMSQDEDDTESRDPLDFDPSMHKRKQAEGEKPNACSKTNVATQPVDGNSVNHARPRAYSAPGAPDIAPKKPKNESTSLFTELYKALSYDGEEVNTSNDTKESSLPAASLLENRTTTGITAVTGASVFSGISDFIGTPLRNNADVSQPVDQPRSASPPVPQDEEEDDKNKIERELKDDKVNVTKPSSKGEGNQAVVATPTRPRKEDKEDSLDDIVAAAAAAAKKPRERPLWKAVVEPKTGRTYYFHRLTRQTTWTKPDDFNEKMKLSMYWGGPTIDAAEPKPDEKMMTSRTEVKDPITGPSKNTPTVPPSPQSGSVEGVDIVDIVDYKSYDPTDALQVHRSLSHRDETSTEEDQIEAVADEKKAFSNGASANAIVVKSLRSNPAEVASPGIENEEDRPDSKHEDRPASKQACKDPTVENKKPMRKLLSCWRKQPTAVREKAVVKVSTDVLAETPNDDLVSTSVSTNDESSREPSILASKLVAEVEERLDPTTEHPSYERDEDGIESAMASTTEDNYVLGAEGGFERVLSSVAKEPRFVAAAEEVSISKESETQEDYVAPTDDVARNKDSVLSMKKDENAEPKLKGLLRRFKSKSQKNPGKEEAPIDKEDENVVVPEPLKFSVFAEIDAERSLTDLKDEPTRSGRTARENSILAGASIQPTQSKLHTPPGKLSTVVKQKQTTEKGVSPSSVLEFVNVDADELPATDEPKQQRPVWKSVADPATGRIYYYHRLTRKTTWTKPDDFDEPVKSTNEDGVDRESVKCNLEERFAAAEEEEERKTVTAKPEGSKVAAKAVKPKQKETGSSMLKRVFSLGKISKSEKARESKKAEDTKKPVSSEPVDQFVEPPAEEAANTSSDLLGTVVDSHTKASSLIQEELQRVSKLFSETAEGLAENEPHAAMTCAELEAENDPSKTSSLIQEELERVSKLFSETAEQLVEKEPTASMTCLEAETAKVALVNNKDFVDAPADELEDSFLGPADEVTGKLATGSLATGSLATGSLATKEEEQQKLTEQQLAEQHLQETVWGDLLFL